MTINRAFPPSAIMTLAALLALAGCDGAVPRADERAPSHPAPAVMPPPLPPRAPARIERAPVYPPPAVPAVQDWRDVPLPAGDWTWAARAGGSVARFAVAGQVPVAVLLCDRGAGAVRIALPLDPASGASPAPRAASITSSTRTDAVSAEPAVIDGVTMLAITLPASSRLLDAMAFSRGRFRLSISGSAPLVLPSWSEVGRVVEDCRG